MSKIINPSFPQEKMRFNSFGIWFLFGIPWSFISILPISFKKLRSPQILKFVPRKRFCTFFSSCLSFLAFCLCIGIFWKRMKIKCIVLFDPEVNHNLILKLWKLSQMLSVVIFVITYSHICPQKSHFRTNETFLVILKHCVFELILWVEIVQCFQSSGATIVLSSLSSYRESK